MWEGFVKYAVEMGSGAIIYIPSSIKIGSGIQKFMECGYTYRQQGDLISLILFIFSKQGYLAQIVKENPWRGGLLQKLVVAKLLKKFPTFVVSDGSLPCSQQPAAGISPESVEFSPHQHTLFA
jgi:hypothetical protein